MTANDEAREDAAPVLVEMLRGEMVESRHRGSFVVVDAGGHVVASAGDIAGRVFPRSAVKPLQALPLVESGAADALGLGHTELALACASHKGEKVHVEKVRAFLERAGLGVADLECGAHRPSGQAADDALVAAGEPPTALHNNCSGKHTGFLVTARFLGEATRGYIGFEHPVQQRVARAMGEMMDVDLTAEPWGVDGCGIPSFAVPLRALALGMARMADPRLLPAPRRAAATRILDAMAAAPLMVDGTGGMTMEIMQTAGDKVRLKPGAEGVYCAALPERGLGIALKIDDGGKRAAEFAIIQLLDRLGCFTEGQRIRLARHLHPVINNVVGLTVAACGPQVRWQNHDATSGVNYLRRADSW